METGKLFDKVVALKKRKLGTKNDTKPTAQRRKKLQKRATAAAYQRKYRANHKIQQQQLKSATKLLLVGTGAGYVHQDEDDINHLRRQTSPVQQTQHPK